MGITKTIKFSRELPKRSSSNHNLEAVASGDSRGRIKHLPSGETVILTSELGFMELIYHVAVYAPVSRPLRRDRMVLTDHHEFTDDYEKALEKFEQVTQ